MLRLGGVGADWGELKVVVAERRDSHQSWERRGSGLEFLVPEVD